MKYRFIAPVHFMKLDSLKNKGIKLYNGARLSNGDKILAESIYKESMEKVLGYHSMKEFVDSTYVYLDNDIPEIVTTDHMEQVANQITYTHLRQIQGLITQLWKIKDNSVYVRDGFLIVDIVGGQPGEKRIFKASLSEIFTYADCSVKPTVFSTEEISRAVKWYNDSRLEGYYKKEDYGGKYPNADHLLEQEGVTSRMIRANYFTQVARRNSIYPTKIVSYCNALECLFTTGYTKISHNIAERTSEMVGGNDEVIYRTYSKIKEAYKYRSIISHGQSLAKDEDNLRKVCIYLDSVLRYLLRENHEIFTKSNKEMEAYFHEISQGTPSVF